MMFWKRLIQPVSPVLNPRNSTNWAGVPPSAVSPYRGTLWLLPTVLLLMDNLKISAILAATVVILTDRIRKKKVKCKRKENSKLSLKPKYSVIAAKQSNHQEQKNCNTNKSANINTDEAKLIPCATSAVMITSNLNKEFDSENIYRELALHDTENYRQCLKMDTDTFYDLYNLVKPLIQRKDTVMRECISASQRLAITLRYLALGGTQKSIATEFNIAQNTLSGIIPDVCHAVSSVLKDKYLKLPSSAEDWIHIANKFDKKCGFPWCIGIVDGRKLKLTQRHQSDIKLLKLQTKNPVNLITLVNADYQFLIADIGMYGDICSDGQWERTLLGSLFANSSLHMPSPVTYPGYPKAFPFISVTSDPFPLKTYMMKPYLDGSEHMDDAKRIFNFKVSKVKKISENTLGILGNRFQVYNHPLRTSFENGKDIILSTIVLHNFLMNSSSSHMYFPPDFIDREDSSPGIFYPGRWGDGTSKPAFETYPHTSGSWMTNDICAEEIRSIFCNYFYSVSCLPRI